MKSIRKKIGYIRPRELREAIYEIAEIIHMQMPLRYQDEWVEKIVERGIWKPETEEVGACCRNGCSRCEQ